MQPLVESSFWKVEDEGYLERSEKFGDAGRRSDSKATDSAGCVMHHSRNGFLTVRGYAENAQQTSLEGLAPRGEFEYVDSMGSVSALVEVEDLYEYCIDTVIDEQARRFHNGR